MDLYAVSAYYGRSETTYTFLVPGPKLDAFIEKLETSGKIVGSVSVDLLNHFETFDTGTERALELS